jgi:hypothetical protein
MPMMGLPYLTLDNISFPNATKSQSINDSLSLQKLIGQTSKKLNILFTSRKVFAINQQCPLIDP